MKPMNRLCVATLSALALTGVLGQSVRAQQVPPLIPNEITASTVPANGDVNPYGVAFVPGNFASGGILNHGDILVTNFNNKAGLQGLGTSVVRIAPNGATSLFYQSPSTTKYGMTTALGYLSKGIVVVGFVPTVDGTSATVKSGGLLLLDNKGRYITNISDAKLLNGPWGLAVFEDTSSAKVTLFVSNVLGGTITRVSLTVTAPTVSGIQLVSKTQIGSGYLHHTDPAALVVGPNGLVYDPTTDQLYVASTGDNAIYSLPKALTRKDDSVKMGTLIYRDMLHLHGPLGLVLAPNGHLLTANGDVLNVDMNHPNELTEFTTDGKFVAAFPINLGNAGAAFGLALATDSTGQVLLAAVDDDANAVHIFHLRGK